MASGSDSIASQIVENIAGVLRGAMDSDGVRVFGQVMIVSDTATFLKYANGLNGATAGILAGIVSRMPGMDNSDDHIALLRPNVMVAVQQSMTIGGDTQDLIERVDGLVSQVRDQILADRTRGGLAQPIRWRGRLIKGTEAYDEPRPLKIPKGSLVYAVEIPVSVGWAAPSVPR